jgi:hypothetical protein
MGRRRRRLFQGLVIAALATVFTATAGSGRISALGQRAPVNKAAPSISGVAVEGQAMTADPGRWTGPAATYSFQWRRCDSSGAACSAIAAATRRSYVLVAADVGKTLRVTVVASNKNGSAAATSPQTPVVASAPAVASGTTSTSATTTTSSVPPSNTAPPTISGTPQQGQTLTAAPGSWSGTTPLSYTYQWRRCDTVGASCAAISGATNTSYLLTSADVSFTIRVSVTARNSVGSATASSAATAVVASPPAPSGTPPSGRVLYKKTGEGAAAVYGTGSLEEACYPDLPLLYSQDFCRWAKVSQNDPPVCGPVKDSNDPFSGTNSIRYDVAVGSTATRCEIGKMRLVDAYTDDYYHTAFKLEPDWGETNAGGGAIHQLNFQSINGAPLFVSVDDRNDSAYLLVNSGACGATCTYYSGQPIGGGFAPKPAGMPGPLYVIPPGGLARGVWHEVLFRVYWTPRDEGVLEAWYRPRGGAWVKRLDLGPVGSGHATQFDFPTLQTGVQKVPQGCTTVTAENITDSCHWATQDKMGQYMSNYTSANGTNSMWGEFCRASSREAAETCLG